MIFLAGWRAVNLLKSPPSRPPHLLRKLALAGTTSFAAVATPVLAQLDELHLQLRGGWIASQVDGRVFDSWLNSGTGVSRYDGEIDDVRLTQAELELDYSIADFWSLNSSLLWHDDGEDSPGVSELFVRYQPITGKHRQRLRLGAFYPEMSLENVDKAWGSPFTYSFSAINSWLAEEMRVVGTEYQWLRPGRRFRSPHTLGLTGAIFTGNDAFGSLLAWRGWAIHDRQSKLGERVPMADYPSFQGKLDRQPNWVEPFKETDHRLGYYLGGRWSYRGRSDLRVYVYDNRGDGNEVEASGQYAWETEFISIAWQYRFSESTRLLTQWMDGSTVMGERVVDVDFSAYYLLIDHRLGKHRISGRVDDFEVDEQDEYSFDPNDSDGRGLTLSWRYDLQPGVQLGVEYMNLRSNNENRALWGWSRQQRHNQWQLLFEFFH